MPSIRCPKVVSAVLLPLLLVGQVNAEGPAAYPACARTLGCMDGYYGIGVGPCCPDKGDYRGYGCCQFRVEKVRVANRCGLPIKIWGQSGGAVDARVVDSAPREFAPGGGFLPALPERLTFSFNVNASSSVPPVSEGSVVYEMNPSRHNQIANEDFWWPHVIHSNFIAQMGFTDLNLDVAWWKDESMSELVCDELSGGIAYSRAKTQFKLSECASLGEDFARRAAVCAFDQDTCVPMCPGTPGKAISPDPAICPGIAQACVLTPAECPAGDSRSPCLGASPPVFNEYARYVSENSLKCLGGAWWRSPPSVGRGFRQDWKLAAGSYALDNSCTFECWDAGRTGPQGMNHCVFPVRGVVLTITACPDFPAGAPPGEKLRGDGTERCGPP